MGKIRCSLTQPCKNCFISIDYIERLHYKVFPPSPPDLQNFLRLRGYCFYYGMPTFTPKSGLNKKLFVISLISLRNLGLDFSISIDQYRMGNKGAGIRTFELDGTNRGVEDG